MENGADASSFPPPEAASLRQCPQCGRQTANDWRQRCEVCGAALPSPEDARRAEIGHIRYVLHEVSDWRLQDWLTPYAETRLRNRYLLRHRQLLAELSGKQESSASAAEAETETAPPIVPALPLQTVVAPAFGRPLPASVVAARGGAARPPKAAVPSALSLFFRKNGLQVVFALATVLVLAAVRSMLAWQWMDQVLLALLPCVPMGLAAMFWMFGQKTRQENPWAAFVYHGLTAALLGFTVIAANKYWLSGALTAKPAFLAASLAATAAAGYLAARWREIPYLHLFQTGALTALYAVLQVCRPDAALSDLRPQPLPLFGGAYLLYSALCFGAAHLVSRSSDTATEPETPDTGEKVRPGMTASARAWTLAWTLWAHLSVLAFLLFSAFALLIGGAGMSEFATLLTLTGLIYAAGAQLLHEPRMVRAAGLFTLAGGMLWLFGAHTLRGNGFGFLLLGESAAALALSAYNARRTALSDPESGLAADWRQIAQIGVGIATLLVWGEMLLLMAAGQFHANEAADGAPLALLCAMAYLLFARWERRAGFVYIGLSTGGLALASALAWQQVPFGVHALAFTLYGLLLCALSGSAGPLQSAGAEPKPETPFSLAEWREPLARCGHAAVMLPVAEGFLVFLSGPAVPHLALSLAPGLIAAGLLAAVRRESGRDLLRSMALGALFLGAALEVGIGCGMRGGFAGWSAEAMRAGGAGLLALGWGWWLLGRAFTHGLKADIWSGELALGGLATAFGSSVLLTLSALRSGPLTGEDWTPFLSSLLGAFLLFCLHLALTRRQGALRPSLAIVVMAGCTSLLALRPETRFVLPAATLCALTAGGLYLALARPLDSRETAWCSLLPLVGGVLLTAVWRVLPGVARTDALLADAFWTLGGVGGAWGYYRAARWSRQSAFTSLAALALTGAYLRGITLFRHPGLEWTALILLPLLAALTLLGLRVGPENERLIGAPLRRTALVVSALALVWSAGNGDGFLHLTSRAPSPWVMTLTLAVYGIAYGLLAAWRRTPRAVALGAGTLTAAYLHYLLSRTALLPGAPVEALLSWPQFAFWTVQAALFWLLVGGRVGQSEGNAELANPLLSLAAILALLSAGVGLLTVGTPGEAMWTILTLGWAGVVWFGLWLREQGEVCLHIGTGNLFAAWGLILYQRFGADVRMMDIYLLPVGLYLLVLGHIASHRKRLPEAHRLWYAGLLLLLTPACLAYWNHAGAFHTPLLLTECLLAVLWGIGQRIRAFVLSGLGFAALYGASNVLGRLPDVLGTLFSLLLGVTLFIVGFYALTHREKIQQWAARLEAQWAAWQAWR